MWSLSDFRANLRRYNDSFCAFADQLRDRLYMICSSGNLLQLYLEMMDTINKMTFQLQSLPGQLNAINSIQLTAREMRLRKLTSIQLNIQRLSSKAMFDHYSDRCCMFGQELLSHLFHNLRTKSDMESFPVMPISTNIERIQQLKRLRNQLKEVREFNMLCCMFRVLPSSLPASITFDIGNKKIVQSPLFDYIGNFYGLIADCSRAQYAILEEKVGVHRRAIDQGHMPPLIEAEALQNCQLWIDIVMQHASQSFSVIQLLLNKDCNGYYKMLLCRKIRFIEVFVRSVSEYVSLFISKLFLNNTDLPIIGDDARNRISNQVNYLKDNLNVPYQAIQCIDELISMNNSGFVINAPCLLITQSHLCRMILYYGLSNWMLSETHRLEHKWLILDTCRQLSTNRRDENGRLYELSMSSETILTTLQELKSKTIELEKEVFVLKSSITNDHQRESVLFREQVITIYLALIKYIRACVSIILRSTSAQTQRSKFFHRALNHELSLLLPRFYDSLESMKQFEENMSQETDRDVWTFRKRVTNVVFSSLALEIVSLSPISFVNRLRKIDDAGVNARNEGKTTDEIREILEMAIEQSIDRDDDGESEAFLAIAAPLINAPLSCRLVSRSSIDTVSASEEIRKWEVLSENAYWKEQVLKKNLLLKEIEAVLKNRYGVPQRYDHNNNDHEDEEEKVENDQKSQHESKYQQYREEYERCASSLQFIEDQWLLIPQHERNPQGKIEFDEFLIACNEIVEDQERIDIYKKLCNEEMHASVEKAFKELSMHICSGE